MVDRTSPCRTLCAGLLVVLLVVLLPGVDARAQFDKKMAEARDAMVDKEIVAAGVKNPRVIQSMRTTPRHEFVPRNKRDYAYFDMALPIGESQTISPPFVVAFMTEAIDPQPTDKVLEIGTGSGYQAAVLSPLVREVYTIEIVPSLGRQAAKTLKRLKYRNVHAMVGDGYKGWPKVAPFDKIIVTCSPESVPPALVAQLKEGGKMVVPVGQRYQQTMYLLKKVEGKMELEALRPTLFVPMTGAAETRRQVLPDPANPQIVNGDFEETSGDPPIPTGWHYQRQLTLGTDAGVPSGKNYITFTNEHPGRGSQALQGMAIDGRKVKELELRLNVSGKGLRPGQTVHQMPILAITFFDEKRVRLGQRVLGPWRGTFGWIEEAAHCEVPPRAREAIVRIGLLGAVGEISFDNIVLKKVK